MLMDDGKLFDHLGIDKTKIKYTQQYEWNIKHQYEQFRNLKPRPYVESPSYKYITGEHEIKFHFKCYGRYSDKFPNCAFFLYLDDYPQNMEGVSIEMDLLCEKKKEYRHLISTQWLSPTNRFCGCQTFPYTDLQNNESIKWKIAMKLHEIQFIADDQDGEVILDTKMLDDKIFRSGHDELAQLCRNMHKQITQLQKQVK